MAHKNKEIQVVIVPFHGQAHMNPMLQFAKRLASKGVSVTIAATTRVIQQMLPTAVSTWKSITLEPIYDNADNPTVDDLIFFASFEAKAASKLDQLLAVKKEQAPVNGCLLVYHWGLPWVRGVAHRNNVYSAALVTSGGSAIVCYYAMYLKSQGKAEELELPEGFPPPELVVKKVFPLWRDIPKDQMFHPTLMMILNSVADTVHADLLLLSSFEELEHEAVEWMSKIWKAKTIGPTIPSSYLDNRLENDVVYGFNNISPDNGDCIKWLNTKPNGSVVYIAFGSIAQISAAQTAEIAEALKQSQSSFLWVVRETEQAKLPIGFIEEALSSGKGMVVSWSPQLEVLAHGAVGCFMSHCGWNSTIEALSFGVPVLAMPQFLDQTVDAYFMEHVWGVGIVAPTTHEDGRTTHEEIRRCLDEIMSGLRGREIKEKATMWKALAKEASDEGGSSDKHIDEIIKFLASS